MKDQQIYRTKQSFEVKDVDTKTRRVIIALSKFDNVDSDGDVIRKGAFTKSIQERGPESTSNRKIAFLRYHDWEHPIGKFISLEETNEYLIAHAELGRGTKGEDALLDYQDGIIKEHSIGFNYVTDKMNIIESNGQQFKEIKEVILWEGSAVTFGANQLTPTLDVSKGEHIDHLEKLNTKMNNLLSALRNGTGTDERLYGIEMALKVCQQQYNSLINVEPVEKQLIIEKPKEEKNDVKLFYLNLLK